MVLKELAFTEYTSPDAFTEIHKPVPAEAPVTIRVNGKELVTLLCTPENLKELALGFLYLEGFISGMDDVLLLRVCDEEREIEARLREEVSLPAHQVIVSG
ncbi:MAG TPA: hypothetical protein ENG33_06240, partial [Chloroflexi bacterium]|nr:hypothetical protein [Chloroflexota bacterium]